MTAISQRGPAWWEARTALDRGLPVSVLMASENWRPELREDDDGHGGSQSRHLRRVGPGRRRRGAVQALACPPSPHVWSPEGSTLEGQGPPAPASNKSHGDSMLVRVTQMIPK